MNKIKMIYLIILFGFLLRVYGISWDQGFHFHPDERMLLMVAERINFFKNLNPNFFNYGSLPIYLLKGVSQIIDVIFKIHLSNYQGMLYVGRSISIFSEIITIYFIYKIGLVIFKKEKTALWSALIYAISFFPIQNSHFFVTDVLLNTQIVVLLYLLIKLFNSRSKKYFILIFFCAMIFAAMMATKFTSLVLLPVILMVIVLRQTIKKEYLKVFYGLFVFTICSSIFFFIFMPYAFINFSTFFKDVTLQTKMNSNPYIFPYTLQYVGTPPYLYYLKNIFLWGLGPIISSLSLVGIIFFIKNNLSKKNLVKSPYLLLVVYYLFYFLVIGRSSVKFMRYLLPLYPFLSLMTGYALSRIKIYKWFLALAFLWTILFVNIYSKEHTRLTASQWINNNIPIGSTLSIEHWDDLLPAFNSSRYKYVEMNLYDLPDNNLKWNLINQKIDQADYIILASNRLYIPLQKLSDCSKYSSCYPKTAEYYKKLFSGKLGFTKVAEFTVYPGIRIGDWKLEIKDDSADESFTVYDHPKIIIFKKNHVSNK